MLENIQNAMSKLDEVRTEPCKKVMTFATGTGVPNGHLVELFRDGAKTTVYLTVTSPGTFKGYHLHRVRRGRMVCLRGKVNITVVAETEKKVVTLDAAKPERLLLPTNVYIGIENMGDAEAWLVNFPDPPYDPALKDEQLEKTPEEIAAQLNGV